MTEPLANSATVLLDDFLDRAKEHLEEKAKMMKEVKEIDNLVKEDLAEMKAQGFDTKILKQLMAIAMETAGQRADRLERQAVLEAYKQAAGLADE